MGTFLRFILVLAILMVMSVSAGCAVCTTEQTRCMGNVAEICDSRGQWRQLMDCDGVEGDSTFTCQSTIDEGAEAHTCLPEQEGGE
jgi:hypothetical protein